MADSPSQRVIWDYAGEDGQGLGCIESSPTVYADTVYVGTSWYTSGLGEGYDVVALNAADGTLLWQRDLNEEMRATCGAADGHVYAGVDTGRDFYKLAAGHGDTASILELGTGNYFVGSAALCSANLVFVGNDNGNFYALRQSSLTPPLAEYYTWGRVCSSPAISYAAQSGYRWVYAVSRGHDGRFDDQGTLLAFRTHL